MENLESLLRDELDRPPAYTRASVSDLIGSTRRIRRRRNLTSGLSAAVAVLAVAALTATLIRTGRTVDPANQPHPTVSSAMNQVFKGAGLPFGGRFIDADHGVLLVGRCPEGLEAFDKCSVSLEATSDGGLTFQKRRMPVDVGIFGAILYVFDAQHLVLDRPAAIDMRNLPTPSDLPTDFPGSDFPTDPAAIASMYPSLFPSGFPSYFATDMPTDLPSGFPSGFPTDFPTDFPTALPSNIPTVPAARWISGDGGQTWSSVSTTPGSSVSEIPAGAQVVNSDPAGDLGQLGVGGPTVASVLTPDGVAHPIATAPKHSAGAQTFGSPNSYSGEVDGCYFLYVQNPNFSQTGLVISRDQGRTWHEAGITGDSAPLAPIGAADGRLYMSNLDFADPISIRIFMSTDHGVSWAPIALPDRPDPSVAPSPADAVPPDVTGPDAGPSAAVLRDGSLLYSDGTHLWKLDAGGPAFRRIDGDGVTTYGVADLGALAFGVRSVGADKVGLATTNDGTDWHTLSFAR